MEETSMYEGTVFVFLLFSIICGAKYAPSQIQKLMKEDEPAAAKAADIAPLDEVHALCRQGKYVQASAACEALSRSYSEDVGVWNAWADVLFSWMKEKRRPLVSGYCFVNVSAVFEAAAQADPTIKERKERMYHAMAEAILSGKASLFNAFASKRLTFCTSECNCGCDKHENY
jgi:hypothetical protein